MGLRTRKIHALTGAAILLAVFLFAPALAAQDLSSGSYTVLKRYIFPRYGGDSELEYLIYGATAVNKGSLIYLTSPMIDIIDGSYTTLKQIDTIDSTEEYPKPYKLGADDKTIANFWSQPHHSHSQAWIFANKATFDKSTNILTSDELAHFRSRQLDADGVGFDAFNDRKFIHIRSKVRVVLRLDENPLDAKAPNTASNSTEGKQP